ncbi:MAG: hypothetical protein RL112_2619 [Planctomycetota bacterium]
MPSLFLAALLLSSLVPTSDLPEGRRVLVLKDGAKVRVLCKQESGRWSVKDASGWRDLPPGQVAAARDEAQALKEWREARGALRAAAGRDGEWKASVASARRAAELGLHVEALGELDSVLRARPDEPQALAVVREHDLLLVPEARDEKSLSRLLELGPTLPPAAREAVALKLATASDKDALRARLRGDLGSTIVARRTFAMLALRRLHPGEARREAAMHAMFDPSADARREAARMLACARDAATTEPFAKALAESASPLMRERAAEALGHMGYAAAVPALVARLAQPATSAGQAATRPPRAHVHFGSQRAYVADFDVEVAQFSAVADPTIGTLVEGSVLEVAVVSTTVAAGARAQESVAVRAALSRLVGLRMDTSREWLAWWEREGRARHGS